MSGIHTYINVHPHERIKRNIKIVESGCWVWQLALDRYGYGLVRVNCVQQLAHRASYKLFVGEIPHGMHIDHLCKVKSCVNPAHLEAVTQAENNRRCTCASTLNSRKTHCKLGHPLNGDNLRIIGGKRICCECRRLNSARYRQKKQLKNQEVKNGL